jgi:hypothetical protein
MDPLLQRDDDFLQWRPFKARRCVHKFQLSDLAGQMNNSGLFKQEVNHGMRVIGEW